MWARMRGCGAWGERMGWEVVVVRMRLRRAKKTAAAVVVVVVLVVVVNRGQQPLLGWMMTIHGTDGPGAGGRGGWREDLIFSAGGGSPVSIASPQNRTRPAPPVPVTTAAGPLVRRGRHMGTPKRRGRFARCYSRKGRREWFGHGRETPCDVMVRGMDGREGGIFGN